MPMFLNQEHLGFCEKEILLNWFIMKPALFKEVDVAERGVHFTDTCSVCGKKYQVQEVNTGPWSWQPQEIECPYCQKVRTKKTSGTFKTTKLEND